VRWASADRKSSCEDHLRSLNATDPARLLGEVFDELFGKVPAGLADRSYFPADAPVSVTLTAGLVSRLLEDGADVAEAIGGRSNL
jgi:hypothetical protein